MVLSISVISDRFQCTCIIYEANNSKHVYETNPTYFGPTSKCYVLITRKKVISINYESCIKLTKNQGSGFKAGFETGQPGLLPWDNIEATTIHFSVVFLFG